jgi:hypothetical protein
MPPPPSPEPELSPRARALLLELRIQRVRHGPGAMVKDKDLAKSVHVSERDVIDLAGELIDAGYLVPASCDVSNPGRCLLKPGDDLMPAVEYLKVLRSRGVKVLWRRRRFRDALRAAGAGQLNLPLEEVS